MEPIEVPDILPEIKQIDISDELFLEIRSPFQPERLSERAPKGDAIV